MTHFKHQKNDMGDIGFSVAAQLGHRVGAIYAKKMPRSAVLGLSHIVFGYRLQKKKCAIYAFFLLEVMAYTPKKSADDL